MHEGCKGTVALVDAHVQALCLNAGARPSQNRMSAPGPAPTCDGLIERGSAGTTQAAAGHEAEVEAAVEGSFQLEFANSDTLQEASLIVSAQPTVTAAMSTQVGAPGRKVPPLRALPSLGSGAVSSHIGEGRVSRGQAPPAATTDSSGAVRRSQNGSTSPHTLSERSAEGSRVSGTDSLLGIGHAMGILGEHRAQGSAASTAVLQNSASAGVGEWRSPSGSSLLAASPRTGTGPSSATSDYQVSPRTTTAARLSSGTVTSAVSTKSASPVPAVAGSGAVGPLGGVARHTWSASLRSNPTDAGAGSSAAHSRRLSSKYRMGTERSTGLSGSFHSAASSAPMHALVGPTPEGSTALSECSIEENPMVSPPMFAVSAAEGSVPGSSKSAQHVPAAAAAAAVQLSPARQSPAHKLPSQQLSRAAAPPSPLADTFHLGIGSGPCSPGEPHLAAPPAPLQPVSELSLMAEAPVAVVAPGQEAEATKEQAQAIQGGDEMV